MQISQSEELILRGNKKCLKLKRQERVIPIDSNGCSTECGDLNTLQIRAREGNASQHS